MNRAIIIGLVALLFLGANSFFTVNERETALKLQLGRVAGADYEPGLHFKLPFVQNVLKFDARLQTLDAEPARYLTAEKKNLMVDSFVKWRIKDVETFYTATTGSQRIADQRLGAVIIKQLRDEFGKRTVTQVVSGQRNDIMDAVAESATGVANQLGIEVVDVRIKRIDLPNDVVDSVFSRMEAEREKIARELRSEGDEQARRIRAEADRQVEVLIAEANRDRERLRGEGDAEATSIYAEAFGADPEFFSFYRSLNAYRAALAKQSDVLVLQPDSEFFKYFNPPVSGTTGGAN